MAADSQGPIWTAKPRAGLLEHPLHFWSILEICLLIKISLNASSSELCLSVMDEVSDSEAFKGSDITTGACGMQWYQVRDSQPRAVWAALQQPLSWGKGPISSGTNSLQYMHLYSGSYSENQRHWRNLQDYFVASHKPDDTRKWAGNLFS